MIDFVCQEYAQDLVSNAYQREYTLHDTTFGYDNLLQLK